MNPILKCFHNNTQFNVMNHTFIYFSFLLFIYATKQHNDDGETDNVALVFKTINGVDTGNWLCYIEGTDAKRSFRMVVNGKLQSLLFTPFRVIFFLNLYLSSVHTVGYPNPLLLLLQ